MSRNALIVWHVVKRSYFSLFFLLLSLYRVDVEENRHEGHSFKTEKLFRIIIIIFFSRSRGTFIYDVQQ